MAFDPKKIGVETLRGLEFAAQSTIWRGDETAIKHDIRRAMEAAPLLSQEEAEKQVFKKILADLEKESEPGTRRWSAKLNIESQNARRLLAALRLLCGPDQIKTCKQEARAKNPAGEFISFRPFEDSPTRGSRARALKGISKFERWEREGVTDTLKTRYAEKHNPSRKQTKIEGIIPLPKIPGLYYQRRGEQKENEKGGLIGDKVYEETVEKLLKKPGYKDAVDVLIQGTKEMNGLSKAIQTELPTGGDSLKTELLLNSEIRADIGRLLLQKEAMDAVERCISAEAHYEVANKFFQAEFKYGVSELFFKSIWTWLESVWKACGSLNKVDTVAKALSDTFTFLMSSCVMAPLKVGWSFRNLFPALHLLGRGATGKTMDKAISQAKKL